MFNFARRAGDETNPLRPRRRTYAARARRPTIGPRRPGRIGRREVDRFNGAGMTRNTLIHVLAFFVALAGHGATRAAVAPDAARQLYERISPSIVAVQYVWETELGRRELTGTGVIVSADGLVVMSIGVVDPRIPDDQMQDFRIIVPQKDADPLEVDATFAGRDERTNLAF